VFRYKPFENADAWGICLLKPKNVAAISLYSQMQQVHYLLHPLQRHIAENSKQIFPGKQLRCYSPNFYIHVSVGDLYILLIGLPILLLENRWAERGNIKYRSLTNT
jgi:hypothetical protein